VAAKGNTVLANVPEDAVDGALEEEPADSSKVAVATGDGCLNGVGDRVDHGIHGEEWRGRHLLPLR